MNNSVWNLSQGQHQITFDSSCTFIARPDILVYENAIPSLLKHFPRRDEQNVNHVLQVMGRLEMTATCIATDTKLEGQRLPKASDKEY